MLPTPQQNVSIAAVCGTVPRLVVVNLLAASAVGKTQEPEVLGVIPGQPHTPISPSADSRWAVVRQ